MNELNQCAGCGELTRHMKDDLCKTCERKLSGHGKCEETCRNYPVGEHTKHCNEGEGLGNGQVPLQAAAAFSILWQMMEKTQ